MYSRSIKPFLPPVLDNRRAGSRLGCKAAEPQGAEGSGRDQQKSVENGASSGDPQRPLCSYSTGSTDTCAQQTGAHMKQHVASHVVSVVARGVAYGSGQCVLRAAWLQVKYVFDKEVMEVFTVGEVQCCCVCDRPRLPREPQQCSATSIRLLCCLAPCRHSTRCSRNNVIKHRCILQFWTHQIDVLPLQFSWPVLSAQYDW